MSFRALSFEWDAGGREYQAQLAVTVNTDRAGKDAIRELAAAIFPHDKYPSAKPILTRVSITASDSRATISATFAIGDGDFVSRSRELRRDDVVKILFSML